MGLSDCRRTNDLLRYMPWLPGVRFEEGGPMGGGVEVLPAQKKSVYSEASPSIIAYKFSFCRDQSLRSADSPSRPLDCEDTHAISRYF